MTNDRAGLPRMPIRFPESWKRALGELAIVALGVLLALWADQAMQARQEDARAIGYLERLRDDVRADIRSLRFSRDQSRRRLEITRQVADYYNQIGLQIDQWSAWGDVGITETYFRELAFVVDPELRLRAGLFDPALMRRFLSASGEHRPSSYSEIRGAAPEIGATRADADRILEVMRMRPNFEGYLRDSMYWAQLSALLLDGVILSAEELEATIAKEIEVLSR